MNSFLKVFVLLLGVVGAFVPTSNIRDCQSTSTTSLFMSDAKKTGTVKWYVTVFANGRMIDFERKFAFSNGDCVCFFLRCGMTVQYSLDLQTIEFFLFLYCG